MRIEALLDTNVIVAASAPDHADHEICAQLLNVRPEKQFAVAAHSFAEAFTTLTRRGEAGVYRWTSIEAAAALEVARSITVLVGLTPPQTYQAMRDFAHGGGIGARIYDHLIGQAAVVHGIAAIVTINVRHLRPLFPALEVVTPAEFGSARRTADQAPPNS